MYEQLFEKLIEDERMPTQAKMKRIKGIKRYIGDQVRAKNKKGKWRVGEIIGIYDTGIVIKFRDDEITRVRDVDIQSIKVKDI